jgi:hypothetical protein
MIPLLGPAEDRSSASCLDLGTAPMGLRMHNDFGLGLAKILS